jgi:hypothetical protein
MADLRRLRRRAFSLVEMLIATTLLFLAVGAIVLVSNANTQAYQTGTTSAELESKITIAMNRIVGELRMAGIQFLTIGATGTSARFQRAEGFTAGQTVWSPQRELVLELEAGEVDDGLDNNSNGLVDEHRLVLVENVGQADERRLVLVRWVAELLEGELFGGGDENGNGHLDEAGFFIERVDDDSMIVHLTLQRIDAQGFPITRTARTSVKVRN